MLRLITDFDGPIMDVSERYYQVYLFCLEQCQDPDRPAKPLPKPEFWRLKRACVPERKIGIASGLTEDQAAEFANLRRKTVHSLPYLKYDQLAPGAVEALEKVIAAKVDLVVMTMRRVKELDLAFGTHNLSRFFPIDRLYCLSDDYVKTGDVNDKPLLMERALRELPPTDEVWMVGDTEADMVAAKNHGVKAIAVLSGIRDRNQLECYKPDAIVEDLSEAVDLVLSQSSQPVS